MKLTEFLEKNKIKRMLKAADDNEIQLAGFILAIYDSKEVKSILQHKDNDYRLFAMKRHIESLREKGAYPF